MTSYIVVYRNRAVSVHFCSGECEFQKSMCSYGVVVSIHAHGTVGLGLMSIPLPLDRFCQSFPLRYFQPTIRCYCLPFPEIDLEQV